MKFDLIKTSKACAARLGRIDTAHGTIDTPVFMPVGTRGAVKTLTAQQLNEIDAAIILGNTYHLMLRPGETVMRQAGGLHAFMRWDRPLLTDSGGYQVFSLADMNKVTEEGVHFKSHIDGSSHFLGPIESMQMQQALGSDIVMAFDECPPHTSDRAAVELSLERTLRWSGICRRYALQQHQNLFGIIQGGIHQDLRQQCAEALIALDFEGYAIGGLSVGEPAAVMNRIVETTTPHMPQDKPRYLMGVGTPRNILEAVWRGIDMFDCVMPTRNARNGTAFTWQGKITIKAGRYANDFSPLDPELDSYASQFSKAYVRHLLNVGEITGLTLVTMQNLAFYLDFMKKLRQAIREESLEEFYQRICSIYPETESTTNF